MIIRIKKDKRFTVISRDSLQDKRLTWKATGLLAFLLSLPDDWSVNVRHLSSAKKDGRDGTISGLHELEKAGYVHKQLLHDDSGKFMGYDYMVYEVPPDAEQLPFPEKPETGKPFPENPIVLNTNGTEKTITKEIPLTQLVEKLKTKIPSLKSNGFSLVQKYLNNSWRDGLEKYPAERLNTLLSKLPDNITVGYLEKAVMNDAMRWRMELETSVEQKPVRKEVYETESE